jgi:hypothetical protein
MEWVNPELGRLLLAAAFLAGALWYAAGPRQY